MAKIGLHSENEQHRLYPLYFFGVAYPALARGRFSPPSLLFSDAPLSAATPSDLTWLAVCHEVTLLLEVWLCLYSCFPTHYQEQMAPLMAGLSKDWKKCLSSCWALSYQYQLLRFRNTQEQIIHRPIEVASVPTFVG